MTYQAALDNFETPKRNRTDVSLSATSKCDGWTTSEPTVLWMSRTVLLAIGALGIDAEQRMCIVAVARHAWNASSMASTRHNVGASLTPTFRITTGICWAARERIGRPTFLLDLDFRSMRASTSIKMKSEEL